MCAFSFLPLPLPIFIDVLAFCGISAALTVLRCCSAEEKFNGKLLVPVATMWPPRHAKANDPEFGRALWEFSEELVQQALHRRDSIKRKRY